MNTVKTKTQLTSLLLLAATLPVTSCSRDTEPNAADPNGRTALCVTSGIETRAYDKIWEAGDAIGIYLLTAGTSTACESAANRKYTTPAGGETGTFAPAADDQTIYFPVSENPNCDLVAYYPYALIGSDNLYPVNVVTQTSQQAIDLMTAARVTNKHKNDATVAFVFSHRLVKLEIAIQGDATSITNDQLAGTTVTITQQPTTGTYNVLLGGEVAVTSTNPAEIPLSITPDGRKAQGILLPATTTQDMELIFTVPAPINQTFRWTIKDAANSQAFAAGSKYRYTITIGKVGLNVTSTVADWILGNGDGETGNAE